MGCGQSKSTRVKNAPAPVIIQTQPIAQQETSPVNDNREEPEEKITESESEEPSRLSKQETDDKTEREGPLTKEQITLVQDTWGIVKGVLELEQIGVEFYIRLFQDSPELLQLFSFRDIEMREDVMRSDERLKKQALVTMQHVDLAVTSLNNLGSIVPALKDLGARHTMYKVEEHYYGLVGAALLNTLDKGLGEKFTSEVREAWTAVYGIVADTMKSGAKEMQELQKA